MNETETEIIKSMQNGDIDAFEKLFKIYKTSALRTVYFITGNIHTSEDIVQEAFIKCFYSIKDLKNVEYFKSWFYKLLIRMSWKFSKKDKKLVPVEEIYDEANQENINQAVDKFANDEESKILHEEIEKLELKQKTVVILYYFNGLTVKEISKIIGCFEGTVKSRLYSARKTLKKRLSEFENSTALRKEREQNEVCRFS